MSLAAIDLARYFERVGYAGNPAPAIATLRQLHALHAEAIAFENLSPFAGEAVELDLAALEDKLVRRGRGGYCFEQNLLFSQVLKQLGFQVQWLAARVRWNMPQQVVTPRSHMLLLVTLADERFIADVGFGGMTLTAPLRLTPDEEQATPHEPFRLLCADGWYTLQAKLDEGWKSLYVFDLQEQYQPDYEVSSWYLSTHPRSHFVTGLIAARPEPHRRHALRDSRYSIHHVGGSTQTRILTEVDELKDVLRSAFNIRMPAIPGLDDRLRQLLVTASGQR